MLWIVLFVFTAFSSLAAEKGREHWAYQSRAQVSPPANRDAAWARNEIDQFILARLEKHHLTPAAAASPSVLLRRIYFDLTGLPPSPRETAEFLANPSSEAYEATVDRLLSSPAFGERWGRHWLDVARYGESVTLRGLIFRNAWRYRDYVIDAFNRDLPFNRFIAEQIAGDLLDYPTLEDRQRALAATTFLVLGNHVYEEQDKEQLSMDIVDEQLDTIGKAFMGQTLGCARCHDHKFDPIPTRDYYAMAGILRNIKSVEHANVSAWVEVPLPLEPEEEKKVKEHENRIAELQRLIRKRTESQGKKAGQPAEVTRLNEIAGIVVDDAEAKAVGEWKHSQFHKPYIANGYLHDLDSGKGEKTLTFLPHLVKAGLYEVRLAYTPGENRATKVPVTILHAGGESTVHVNQRTAPSIQSHFVSLGQYYFEEGNQGYVLLSNAGTDGHVVADAVQFLPAERLSPLEKTLQASSADDEQNAKELERLRGELARLNESGPKRPMVMSVRETPPFSDCEVHVRGTVHNLGEKVPRGFLQVVNISAPTIPEDESGRRQLADWLCAPEHPLTSRVIVNRVWVWLLGEGLVRTPDNFGTTGETPTHPELLDFLANRFIQEGWSIKRLVRQIVLSQTYQLSSEPTSQLAEADPENRLFGRANRRRLDAESLRDSILKVSGSLRTEMGGSEIPPGLGADYGYEYKGFRRSVYVPVLRNALPPIFELFDYPDPSMVTGKRHASTVAPQALFFLNHSFVIEQARLAARELLGQTSPPERVKRIYTLALNRAPSEREREIAEKHLTVARTSGLSEEEGYAQLFQAVFASPDFRHLN